MTLKQLRYMSAIVRADLNFSRAARTLHVSQVAISKQIRLLEEELSTKLFLRQGKKIAAITEAGHEVHAVAERMIKSVENISRAIRNVDDEAIGSLTIAATHTQTCYVLPAVVRNFLLRYPLVQIAIRQGTPTQCAEWVAGGDADLCISTEVMERFRDLTLLPCYQWNRCIIAPLEHDLAKRAPLTLEGIAKFPIISYSSVLDRHSKVGRAFSNRGLKPRLLLTTSDSDVIKTYVRLGFGIGILSELAVDAEQVDLIVRDASELFEPSITAIGVRRGEYLPRHLMHFIELFTSTRPRNFSSFSTARLPKLRSHRAL